MCGVVFGGAGNSDGWCGGDEILAAAVVLHSGANPPSVDGMRLPRYSSRWGFVDQ